MCENIQAVRGMHVPLPGVSGGGEIVWTCGHAEVPAGVAPFLEDHGDYNNLEPKYLPSSCR